MVQVVPAWPVAIRTNWDLVLVRHRPHLRCPSRISSWSGSVHTVHCRPDFLDRKPWSDTALICRRHTGLWLVLCLCLSPKLTACSCAAASWMQSNRLQLSSDKTEVLCCATTRRQHQLPRSYCSSTGPRSTHFSQCVIWVFLLTQNW